MPPFKPIGSLAFEATLFAVDPVFLFGHRPVVVFGIVSRVNR